MIYDAATRNGAPLTSFWRAKYGFRKLSGRGGDNVNVTRRCLVGENGCRRLAQAKAAFKGSAANKDV